MNRIIPLCALASLLTLGATPAVGQPTLGTPSVSGDQLIFFYDARTDRTSFLSVANVSDDSMTIDVALYSGDLTTEVAGATLSLAGAANTVIDPSAFGGGGAAGTAGLAVVTPVVSSDDLTPVVPSQPIVGGFTFANLQLSSGFGQNPFARSAVGAGSGAPAAPGTQVDGVSVVYERFDPGILNIPVYFDPATLAPPANDGNRILIAAFADRYDGAFSIAPVSTQAAVTFFDNAGVRIAENSISIDGVLFSDLQSASGGAAIEGSSGKVFFAVNAQGGNVFGLFSQSIGTFAAGQRMPAVEEVPVGVDPPAPPPSGPFSRNALLGQFADELVLPAVRDFASQAQALSSAVGAHARGPNDSTRTAAQAAWSAAMETFQRLEPMQFGPAGSASMFMGGQGIRDEIYSWPITNYCAVDQKTVDDDFRNPKFFESGLVNVYGLDALEVLLFRTGESNECDPRVDINRDGTWSALVGAGGLQQRQADYALVLAQGISQQANRLRDAWEPSGGNFAADVRNAGIGGSVYGSAKEALDEVFAAFFFMDTDLKDGKLAVPAGISPECGSPACPEDVELPFSRESKRALLANLDGASGIFAGEGTAGQGFAWYLRDMGATVLADRMTSQLVRARGSVQAIPGRLSDALSTAPGVANDAHTQIQIFTTDLKSEFVSVLNLTIPLEGAGDND
ncbi:MAG: imelysin family protein [Candidatus Binatia bacterium]|nr:imelysin family protein [Candidatus Binatia bacterium]